MSYQPIVPTGGLVGWRFLTKTMDRQQDTFTNTAQNQRDTDYFRENLSSATTAAELVENRRLLQVALGAYGLQDDLNNRAFIQKILESDLTDGASLANRLSDDRYARFAEDFGFNSVAGPRTSLNAFADRIIQSYEDASFEIAVGEQNEDLRLALNAKRELPEIAARSSSDDTKWFLILGTPPLREVFETALALPSGFGQIDIEQQLDTFKELSRQRLGIETPDQLSETAVVENLIENFLLQSQIEEFSVQTSSMSIALNLLQATG